MVKKQIAPELIKSASLTDKTFLEILRRIDQNFDHAYGVAVGILNGFNFDAKQNRIPDVTKKLIVKHGRLVAERTKKLHSNAAKVPTPPPPPAPAAAITMANGNYVGQVESVDPVTSRICVKYGPYKVEGNAADTEALALKPGNRVTFTMRNNTVSVSAPSALR
jgi:hypothetical protein